MQKPNIPYSKRRSDPQIRVWSGLNRTEGAADGEMIDCRRVHTGAYPAMQTARGRTRVGEWENATDLYETDGHLIVVDEGKLYFDETYLTDVNEQPKQFVEMARKIIVWPDKLYINLNTEEVERMEAEVTGTAILQDGGVISIAEKSGEGSLTLDQAYEYDDANGVGANAYVKNYYMRLYAGLRYDNGWVYDSVTTELPVLEAEEGESSDVEYFFIGTAPQVQGILTDGGWNMDGTVYGKITKITVTKYVQSEYTQDGYIYEFRYWSYRYDYETYDAAAVNLGNTFEVGDSVSIEGFPLKINDREAVRLDAVNGSTVTVAATDLMTEGWYVDILEDLEPGDYKVTYETSGMMGNQDHCFSTDKKIYAGCQLMSDNAATSAELVEIRLYDPETRTLRDVVKVAEAETSLGTWKEYDASTGCTLTIKRGVPDMEFICESGNRLFGVSNKETDKIYNEVTGQIETVNSRVLHASELGYPTRWDSYNGNANDSYAVAVAGEGDFTGLVAYSGAVLAFKEDKMYKLTGSYPAEFYLRGYNVDGLKKGCHRSMVIINEVLYYLSPYGVMAYSGGVPGLISYELGLEAYESASAGRDKTDYWISLHCEKYGQLIYRYDTVRQMWVIETAEQADSFERVGDYVYAVIDGKIWKMADEESEETISWEVTMPESDEGVFEKKRYKQLLLLADVQGSMTVQGRMNDHADWMNIGTISSPGKKVHRISLDAFRCDRIQFKLSGTGKTTVWAMERSFTLESDR